MFRGISSASFWVAVMVGLGAYYIVMIAWFYRREVMRVIQGRGNAWMPFMRGGVQATGDSVAERESAGEHAGEKKNTREGGLRDKDPGSKAGGEEVREDLVQKGREVIGGRPIEQGSGQAVDATQFEWVDRTITEIKALIQQSRLDGVNKPHLLEKIARIVGRHPEWTEGAGRAALCNAMIRSYESYYAAPLREEELEVLWAGGSGVGAA